jgi:hypothetical protein
MEFPAPDPSHPRRPRSSAISDVRGTESFADSPLEESGFEPLVPVRVLAQVGGVYCLASVPPDAILADRKLKMLVSGEIF